MQTIVYILPELFLSIAIMFLLMLGVFIKKSFKLVNLLTTLSLLFAVALVLNQPNEIIKIFNDSYIIDQLSIFMKVLTLLFCFFILLSSKDYIKNTKIDKIEYPILILASTLGMLLMISSYDLIVFYLGLELQSLCLYILASFNREDGKSTESGLDADMFCTYAPCVDCAKLILQSGIRKFYYEEFYKNDNGIDLLKQYGNVYIRQYKGEP